MGLHLSSDKFNYLVEQALAEDPELTNYCKVMDDLCFYAKTLEQLVDQLSRFFKICQRHNLTLSPKKTQFSSQGAL